MCQVVNHSSSQTLILQISTSNPANQKGQKKSRAMEIFFTPPQLAKYGGGGFFDG